MLSPGHRPCRRELRRGEGQEKTEWIFPLNGGEGEGEGKWDVCTDPQNGVDWEPYR